MSDMAEMKMESCRNHPEKQQIFHLERMLDEAGYPYFFNFREDLRPVFGGGEDGDPESIDWNSYHFLIEVGQFAGAGLAQISVCFNAHGDRKLLELLDMRTAGNKKNPTAEDGELHTDMTAEGCMGIIEKFFDALPQAAPPIMDPVDDWPDDEDDVAIPDELKKSIREITGIDPDKVDREMKSRKARRKTG